MAKKVDRASRQVGQLDEKGGVSSNGVVFLDTGINIRGRYG